MFHWERERYVIAFSQLVFLVLYLGSLSAKIIKTISFVLSQQLAVLRDNRGSPHTPHSDLKVCVFFCVSLRNENNNHVEGMNEVSRAGCLAVNRSICRCWKHFYIETILFCVYLRHLRSQKKFWLSRTFGAASKKQEEVKRCRSVSGRIACELKLLSISGEIKKVSDSEARNIVTNETVIYESVRLKSEQFKGKLIL